MSEPRRLLEDMRLAGRDDLACALLESAAEDAPPGGGDEGRHKVLVALGLVLPPPPPPGSGPPAAPPGSAPTGAAPPASAPPPAVGPPPVAPPPVASAAGAWAVKAGLTKVAVVAALGGSVAVGVGVVQWGKTDATRSHAPQSSAGAPPLLSPSLVPEPSVAAPDAGPDAAIDAAIDAAWTDATPFPARHTNNARRASETSDAFVAAAIDAGAVDSASAMLAEEIALIDEARRHLEAGRTDLASDVLARYEREHRSGALAPEATALRIETLIRAGDRKSAQALGERFLSTHPTSPLARRVRALLQEAEQP